MDPAELPVDGFLGRAGKAAIKGKTAAAVAGVAVGGTSDTAIKKLSLPNEKDEIGITNDVMVGVKQFSQVVYAIRDLYEKRDFKSGGALFLDLGNAVNEILVKLDDTIGYSQELIPVVGGAITGVKQLLNLARVNDSKTVLDEILNKVGSLSEKDKAVIESFKTEQTVSQIKHGTQAVIGFLSMAEPLMGPAGPILFGTLKVLIPAVATIRDLWINHVEAPKLKAQRRLGLTDASDETNEQLKDISTSLLQENRGNALASSGLIVDHPIAGAKFSITGMVDVYDELEKARAKLESQQSKDDEDVDNVQESPDLIRQRIDVLDGNLNGAILEYNTKMREMTGKYFPEKFRPISLDDVRTLHDYHVECIRNILAEAASAQDKKENTWRKFTPLRFWEEGKEKFLKEVYDGKVPEKIDIRMADMTADASTYFWNKTKEQIGNAIIEVKQSKDTLIKNLNKVLKQNKSEILKQMKGQDTKGIFQNPEKFESDMKVVVNTLSL